MGEDRSDRVRLGMQPFPMSVRGCCLKKIQVGCQIWFLERPRLEHRNGQKRSRSAVSAAPRSPDGHSLDRRGQDTDGNLAQAQHPTNMYPHHWGSGRKAAIVDLLQDQVPPIGD